MSDSSFLVILFAVVILIVSLVLTPKFDRKRIRENVEAHGGKVIEISQRWGWGNGYDRAYEVSFMARGKRVTATCRTSVWRGVYWVNKRPPGFDSEMTVAGSFAGEEPRGPAEPIRCLNCGSMIPKDQIRCPQCGWSYKSS